MAALGMSHTHNHGKAYSMSKRGRAHAQRKAVREVTGRLMGAPVKAERCTENSWVILSNGVRFGSVRYRAEFGYVGMRDVDDACEYFLTKQAASEWVVNSSVQLLPTDPKITPVAATFSLDKDTGKA